MDYRRNIDKIDQPIGHKVLLFTDITVYPVTEPVTAMQLADYLYIVAPTSMQLVLLDMFISDARARLERASGVSLVEHTYNIVLNYYSGRYKLPFGGTIDEFVVDGNIIPDTDYVYENGFISSPFGEGISITYTTVPIDTSITSMSVLRLAAFMHEHRGDEVSDAVLLQKAHDLSSHYSEAVWLI